MPARGGPTSRRSAGLADELILLAACKSGSRKPPAGCDSRAFRTPTGGSPHIEATPVTNVLPRYGQVFQTGASSAIYSLL